MAQELCSRKAHEVRTIDAMNPAARSTAPHGIEQQNVLRPGHVRDQGRAGTIHGENFHESRVVKLFKRLGGKPPYPIIAPGRADADDADAAHTRSTVSFRKCVEQEMQGS